MAGLVIFEKNEKLGNGVAGEYDESRRNEVQEHSELHSGAPRPRRFIKATIIRAKKKPVTKPIR